MRGVAERLVGASGPGATTPRLKRWVREPAESVKPIVRRLPCGAEGSMVMTNGAAGRVDAEPSVGLVVNQAPLPPSFHRKLGPDLAHEP